MKALQNLNPLELLGHPATGGEGPLNALDAARNQLNALAAATERILSELHPAESRSFLEQARQHGGQ